MNRLKSTVKRKRFANQLTELQAMTLERVILKDWKSQDEQMEKINKQGFNLMLDKVEFRPKSIKCDKGGRLLCLRGFNRNTMQLITQQPPL